ncbi:MAG: lipopolysaccharide biosynthesis protein [Cyanobacteria bacterium P01_D01_bin.123]
MNVIKQYRTKVIQSLSNRFVRNLGWLSAAELVIRVSRLITTVFLARFLGEYDYGLAAIVLTTHELVQVFSETGINEKLIQADESEIQALSQSAYWLNWTISLLLFFMQCVAAFVIARFYRDPNLIGPICATAFVYLIVPFGNVQSSLIKRENRLKVIALSKGAGVSVANIMSLVLAFLGFGVWSFAIPVVATAPLWVFINVSNHKWRPTWKFTTQRWGQIFSFGKHVLGFEFLKVAQNNLDYLIIGRFLSIEALGLYYFAFNAGLGISLSVIKSIRMAILPHLSAFKREPDILKSQYIKSLKVIAAIVIPLAILQSSLAPFYVPLVFGQKWIPAIPILMLICLSAIPRPFADAASQLLVAMGKPKIVLIWAVTFTTIFTTAILIAVRWQALGVAIAVLGVHAVALPLFTVWGSRYGLRVARGKL